VAYANNNIYVGGKTKGTLVGGDGIDDAMYDAFLSSYDRDGNLRWTRQFGTDALNGEDLLALATDGSGNVYAVGNSWGEFPESGTYGPGDSMNVYVRSYDGDGNLRWTQQFGTSSYDYVRGVATDANGNVYIAGDTKGEFPGQTVIGIRSDPYVRSYDVDGNFRWVDQFGSDETDQSMAISTAEDGTVTVAGNTYGSLEGFTNEGSNSADVFMRSYSSDGTPGPLKQFGTDGNNNDFARGIVTGANGSRYLVGKTDGDLTGEGAVGKAFIRSYGRP
jgi:hypothetical protein